MDKRNQMMDIRNIFGIFSRICRITAFPSLPALSALNTAVSELRHHERDKIDKRHFCGTRRGFGL